MELTITGPDSLFSYGEIAQYVAQAAPAFPDSAVLWKIDTVTIHRGGNLDTIIAGLSYPNPGAGDTIVPGDSIFKPLGAGTFQSLAPPLEPKSVTVTIDALIGAYDTTLASWEIGTVQTKGYRHAGYKTVVLTQRVTKIQLRCPDTHACDSLSAGASWTVWVDGFDALGRQIYALTGATTNPPGSPPIATFASRDTTIATVTPVHIRAATVTALRSGMTWIVGTRGALLDSVQVVVH